MKIFLPFLALGLLIIAVLVSNVSAVAPLVQDRADLLTLEQESQLTEQQQFLAKQYDIEYHVLTVNNDEDINLFAHTQYKEMGVAEKNKFGKGLLLVINSKQDQVRLEVSAGLEGVFTDSFVSYIQHRQMVPFFRVGRVADGILATTELIVGRAYQAQQGGAFNPQMENYSAGGGVTNSSMINKGADLSFQKQKTARVNQGDFPAEVFVRYVESLKNRNANPMLPIYTRATQEWKKSWVVTPAQMDTEAREIRQCGTYTVKVKGKYAVIRYPAERDRHCNPYFLVKEEGAWRLDFHMMMKAIKFNHNNLWHFNRSFHHPYDFAFTDWKFDKHGYPHDRH